MTSPIRPFFSTAEVEEAERNLGPCNSVYVYSVSGTVTLKFNDGDAVPVRQGMLFELPYPMTWKKVTVVAATSSSIIVNYGIGSQGGAGGSTAGLSGSGSPEGSQSADPGTTYLDTSSGSFWAKQTGTGNTGWLQLIACLVVLLSFALTSGAQAPIRRSAFTTNANAAPEWIIGDSRATSYEASAGLGYTFQSSKSNIVQAVNGTNSLLSHGTALVRLNGTNYLFITGRTAPCIVRRYEANNLSNYVDCVFTNDANHGNALGAGADTLLYSRTKGKLYVTFNSGSSALEISEVDPLAMTYTDVVSTNFSYTFSAHGATVTDSKYFVGTGSGNGFTVYAFSLTNWALLWSTNKNLSPPPAFPGFFHSMHFDGKYVWGAGYITKPGVVRINPETYAFDMVSITNSGLTTTVPMNDGSGAGFSKPTDDMCTFGNYLYINTEDTNGVVTRIHTETLAVERIRTGCYGVGWGTFAHGRFVYACFPQESMTQTNSGIIARIDPETLRVDHIRAPAYVNELQWDGQNYYATTYNLDTNLSYVARLPVLEFNGAKSFYADTNANFRLAIDPLGAVGLSRTTAYTTAELPLSGMFGFWNSNGVGSIHCSFNSSGSITNKAVAP